MPSQLVQALTLRRLLEGALHCANLWRALLGATILLINEHELSIDYRQLVF